MGCDYTYLIPVLRGLRFQSTHPRGVRHGSRRTPRRTDLVSIHAPTWGATYAVIYGFSQDGVSIHAPTWGATRRHPLCRPDGRFQSTHPRGVRRYTSGRMPEWWTFQSTHPRGVRLLASVLPGNSVEVSIHAPTWGATRNLIADSVRFVVSIHAPTWGATRDQCRPTSVGRFQSTHPRGVRRGSVFSQASRSRFNPRTHVGCDVSIATAALAIQRFQSTHPRGVRRSPR